MCVRKYLQHGMSKCNSMPAGIVLTGCILNLVYVETSTRIIMGLTTRVRGTRHGVYNTPNVLRHTMRNAATKCTYLSS